MLEKANMEDIDSHDAGASPFLMKAEQLDTIPSIEERKPKPKVNVLSAYFPAESSKLTEGQRCLTYVCRIELH